MQGTGICRNLLGLQHVLQMLEHRFRHHGTQVELQAAAQHRHRHLLRIGGGQYEFQVFRRLFQRLEHGVERRVGQHVHFVDHEDLEAPLHRLVDGLLEQPLNLVHAAVGRCIQFRVIDKTACIDLCAGLAYAAGLRGHTTLPVRAGAVERLGQNARNRRLADTARAGKHVGMVQAPGRQRVAERLHDMLLPHHFGEGFGTVFSGEHQIGHGAILNAASGTAWREKWAGARWTVIATRVQMPLNCGWASPPKCCAR